MAGNVTRSRHALVGVRAASFEVARRKLLLASIMPYAQKGQHGRRIAWAWSVKGASHFRTEEVAGDSRLNGRAPLRVSDMSLEPSGREVAAGSSSIPKFAARRQAVVGARKRRRRAKQTVLHRIPPGRDQIRHARAPMSPYRPPAGYQAAGAKFGRRGRPWSH